MNGNCHRRKSFFLCVLEHFLIDVIPMKVKCHRNVSSLSLTLGLHGNYMYKEVSQNKTFSSVKVFVHRHFLYIFL